MKIAYAFRRAVSYPDVGGDSLRLPEGDARSRFLKHINRIGFDGLELGLEAVGGTETTRQRADDLRRELEDYGTPCVAVRGGGGYHDPRTASQNREAIAKVVEVASWLGAGIVNTSTGGGLRFPGQPGSFVGEPVSQGASRTASTADFERTATVLREVGKMAGDRGLNVTLEVHQNSITDNSWSTLHMLDLIDSPHVFANPDLGNIFWTYETPEETSEQAIAALAPRSKYWHCKNLIRVHIPENRHSIFLRVPLPDGEIDYRFAIHAMIDAGYDGYLAVEGAKAGDALHADRRSLDYVKSVIADLEA
jgi:sugar phosphate isomerase/epimerase